MKVGKTYCVLPSTPLALVYLARGTLTEGFDTADLTEAKALLDELS